MRKNSSKTALILNSLVNTFTGNKSGIELQDNEIVQNENADLIKGNAHEVGSVYDFPLVTPGFEALITITGQNSENTALLNDNKLHGNTELSQTVTKAPAVVESEDSWVSFKIDIKNVTVEEPAVMKRKFKLSLNNLF